MRFSEAGYSLLEMLVVLAILGLIAAVATPPISSSIDRMRLSDDTRVLSDALRRVRELALNEQRDVSIAISANTIHSSSGENWILNSGSALEFAGVEGGPTTFAFHADGTASGGTFRIVHGKTVVGVRVDEMSGAVEVVK